MREVTYKKDDVENLVDKLIRPKLKPGSIFLFYGDLGAGKTFFVKNILEKVYKKKDSCSPTFSYVNKYEVEGGFTICHFDLYRISDEKDFLDLGFQDLVLNKKVISFIEWPERIESFLKKIEKNFEIYKINIEHDLKDFYNSRKMTINKF